MRPAKPTLEQLKELGEPIYRTTIPDAWADNNGHVNVRWYAVIYDDAGDVLHDLHALTVESHRKRNSGTMDLEHHTHFISEVMPGEQVAVYIRALQMNAKRFHYLMFLVNESNGKLASIFECINSFVDLNVRKMAPWPEESGKLIQDMIDSHATVTWPAPVCSPMSV